MVLFLGNGTLRKMKMISKTTFKLRSTADLDDLDGNDSTSTMGCGVVGNSSGNNSDDFSLELMEIPLSPTNYNQPPTPPGIGPPPPIVAELEISRVLDRIRTVRFHFQIQNIVLDIFNATSNTVSQKSYYIYINLNFLLYNNILGLGVMLCSTYL